MVTTGGGTKKNKKRRNKKSVLHKKLGGEKSDQGGITERGFSKTMDWGGEERDNRVKEKGTGALRGPKKKISKNGLT